MRCATTLGWPSVSRSLCREATPRRCPVHSHSNCDKGISRRSTLQVAFAGLCLPRVLARREDALAVTNDATLSTTDSGVPPLASEAVLQPSTQQGDIVQSSPAAAPVVAVEVPKPPTAPPSESPKPPSVSKPADTQEEAAKRLLEQEEERRRRRSRRGRLAELEEARSELAQKELVLMQKQAELLEKEQTLMVLREELELEMKLRALLTKDKEKAEEEAALALGLCGGSATMLP